MKTIKKFTDFINDGCEKDTLVVGKMTSSYCGNCKTRHLRQWFSLENGDSFYLCAAASPPMIVVNHDKAWSFLTIDAFVKQFGPGWFVFLWTATKKIFIRSIGKSEFVFTVIPPFLAFSIPICLSDEDEEKTHTHE